MGSTVEADGADNVTALRSASNAYRSLISGDINFVSDPPLSTGDPSVAVVSKLPQKAATSDSSVPTHIICLHDESEGILSTDDPVRQPISSPTALGKSASASPHPIATDTNEPLHPNNRPLAEKPSPRKLLFRNILQMPRNRLRMVQKRTQRVKTFISSHRRSFSRHLRLQNRRERSTTSPKNNAKRSSLVIRAENPYKILFDVCTVFLTLITIYAAHISIRDRSTYEYTPFFIFNKLWFLLDIILNFFTAYTTVGSHVVEEDARAVWARYLTSWFAVDVLSLIPWERLYIKPVIEMQNRRNLFVKSFFRTKAVIRLSTVLRTSHFKYFGRVAHNTKHLGVNTPRLLKLIIKYVPKYLLFYRNMKGILIIKALRLVHFTMKAFRAFRHLRMYLKERSRKNSIASYVQKRLVLDRNSHYGVIASQDDDMSHLINIQQSSSTLLSDGSEDQAVSEGDRLEHDDGLSFHSSDDERSLLRGNDSWSGVVSFDTIDSTDFNNETFDNNSQFE